MSKKSFKEKVYEQVQKIPYGRVATYGQIAVLCGSPKAARAVGNALHVNPSIEKTPCYRVVDRNGYLAINYGFEGHEGQKKLLMSEGIVVDKNYKIDLDKYIIKI